MSFKNETVVETKSCRKCQVSFDITDKDLGFYDKVSPVFNGKKYSIPSPTICPECRAQRKLSFGNERNLYKRKCDATGDEIISIYSPDKTCKVYNQKSWWGDGWDPLDYGRDFDFSRGFFEQYHELSHEVPNMHLYVDANKNSDYVNWTGWSKNLYMCFSGDYSEDSFYSDNFYYSKDSSDCTYCYTIENCYECVDCKDCYHMYFSQNCNDCHHSYYLSDCMGTSHCFSSYGLRNAQYMIFNKQYSKKEYETELGRILNLRGVKKEALIEKVKQHLLHSIHKCYKGKNNENSNGDFLMNCKNVQDCFDCLDTEDSKYSYSIKGGKDLYDVFKWGHFGDRSYECFGVGENVSNMLFCNCVWGNISHSIYCSYCLNGCEHLFGCIGLKNKKYCILNKQYTQAEYEKLTPKIIEKMEKDGEWGEFFPINISAFGYNETIANIYFPLDKQGALEQKFNWSDYEAPLPKVEKSIAASKLPENIADVPDDILNWTIECEVTKIPFRIIKQELEFYRKHNLPIPKKHPDQRYRERMELRNPRKLFTRDCDKCEVKIQTTYAPGRSEKVYCEECYNKEIY